MEGIIKPLVYPYFCKEDFMKKTLAILLALVVVGVFAFADDAAAPAVKWSGSFGTGAAAYSQNSGTTLNEFSPDTWGADRIRLTLSYSAADYGFKARFQVAPFAPASTYLVTATDKSTNTASTTGKPTGLALGQYAKVNQGYGWANFANGLVTVKAGILDDYTVAGPIWDDYGTSDGKTGVWVAIHPVKDLSIGYFLPAGNTSTDLADALQSGFAGFAYSIKDVADINGGIQLATDSSTDTAFWGLNVTAVKDLTLAFEGYVPFTVDNADAPIAVIENVSYPIGKLTVGAMADQSFYKDYLGWGVFPNVSYTVSDAVTVGAYLSAYTFNDISNGNFLALDPVTCGNAVLQGSGAISDGTDLAYGASPYVQFTQGKAKLTIGDGVYVLPTQTVNVAWAGVGFSF
jgi:hypothetical protein